LSVSLAYLRDIFQYMRDQDIRMYRMSSNLAPYVTHPDLPHFHRQIEECISELSAVGRLAQELDFRLSFHPAQHVVLNSPDERLAARNIRELNALARILDRMEQDPEAIIVVHVGGLHGTTRQRAAARFVRRFLDMPEDTRRRLALEHDDHRFSVPDTLWIHRQCGIPLIFDNLHHLNYNPQAMTMSDALASCLDTWPEAVVPKIHFSTPRTEMRITDRRNPKTGRKEQILQPPLWSRHADYVNPFDFVNFMRQARKLRTFDVLLEVKAQDLALLRLRKDLSRFAPELARTIR
jgi:UV DNA damage endonuclease